MKAIIFRNDLLALRGGGFPEFPEGIEPLFGFSRDGEEYGVARFDENSATPSDWEWTGLRESWQTLGDELWEVASKGAELLHFDKSRCYCERCGSKLPKAEGIMKLCPGCGAEVFPAMSPAVMVLVEDGEGRALMVRGCNFKRRFFGLVAGFVETGETLEECVVREVKEETSLEIEDIRYWGSQSWPFPAQLMIGFRARLKSGTLKFADGELCEGGFFSREDMPEPATWPSLARKMIEAWKKER